MVILKSDLRVQSEGEFAGPLYALHQAFERRREFLATRHEPIGVKGACGSAKLLGMLDKEKEGR